MALFEIYTQHEECLKEVQSFYLPTADLTIYDLFEKVQNIFGHQSFQIFWKDQKNSRRNLDWSDQQLQILLAEHQNQLVSAFMTNWLTKAF